MISLPETQVFTIPVRIYFEDTDAGGVVYYANYLKFFERCRSEWLRQRGEHQIELLREPGIAFVVRSLRVDYLKPARLDDLVIVSLEVEKVKGAQIFFRQHIRRAAAAIDGGWEELVRATTQLVCVSSARMKATAIPASLRAKLEAPQ